MRIALYTLGCKVNQYETQALAAELVKRGHDLVDFEASADVYMINTCTVTAVSDKKSRSMIRRARKRGDGAVVAVCGCYAQTDPQAVAALGVDVLSGTGGRLAFLDEVERLAKQRQGGAAAVREKQAAGIPLDDPMKRRIFEHLPAGGTQGRTRAMLKVEDGCVNFCSYCIIPYARGPVRSLPLEDAVCEAKRLAREGYRELVLTGIEISSWGQELRDGRSFLDLLEAVCSAVPELRVRLGSLEPRTITEEFCRCAATCPNLCPHFHLSMQSGCDAVLKRMNRNYDTRRYYESIILLRELYSDPAITTDLMVGFPGESEGEFEQTLAFVEQCAFSSVHIFPYSRRAGTPAQRMAGQVSDSVKERRARQAGELAERLKRDYLARRKGERLAVLFEEEKGGLWRGHAPNYVAVYAPGEGLHNRLRDVEITGLYADGLLGEVR